jgi:hypothetical protein
MGRATLERVEIICTSCGLMAELLRPRNSPKPKLCDCPQPQMVRPSTRPRLCERCSTRLNRYNAGSLCGPCKHADEGDLPLI